MSEPPHSGSPLADAVFTSSPQAWRYISEGKQHIVFAFEGGGHNNDPSKPEHSSAALLGRVLKLSKSVLRAAQSHPLPSRAALVDRLSLTQRYTSGVMRPLFRATDPSGEPAASSSREWFDSGEIVWIPSALASSLLQSAYPLRPDARKKQFDLFHPPPQWLAGGGAEGQARIPAVVLEDYTSPLHLHLKQQQQQQNGLSTTAATSSSPSASPSLPPTICIELKPKWGFLPSHGCAEKRSTCRFCMHQYTKLLKSEVQQHSLFCPLDLFSCETNRVERAVEELFRTPQNNLRIFVRAAASSPDSNTTTPHSSSPPPPPSGHVEQLDMSEEAHVDRLTHILFPHLGNTPIQPGSTSVTLMSDQRALLQAFLVAFLCHRSGPIRAMLRRLAMLQERLDAWDVERVWPMVERMMEEHEARNKEQNGPPGEEESTFTIAANQAQVQPDVPSHSSSSPILYPFSLASSTSHQHPACGSPPPRPAATYAGLHPLLDEERADGPPCMRRGQLWKGLVPPAVTKAASGGNPGEALEQAEVDWIDEIVALVKSNQNSAQSSASASSADATSAPFILSEEQPSSHRLFEFQSNINEPAAPASNDAQHQSDGFPACRSKKDSTAATNATSPADASSSAISSSAEDVDENTLTNILRAFLIATTLKDVSLMCTLQPILAAPEGSLVAPAPLSTRVHYSVRLIDLEVKSIGKLREYWTQDREIVEHHRKAMRG
jgi:hypothetical protein